MRVSKAQHLLILLLRSLINNEKYRCAEADTIDWEAVFAEAAAHQVLGMIYPVIDLTNGASKMPEQLLEKWKRETFLTGTKQMRHISQVAMILDCFSKERIPVIALKGLVIRNDYPRPELRTMCDADLLVNREDLEIIDKCLISKGYSAQEASVVHTQYIHPQGNVIEVHWTIRDERVFKEIDHLERELWQAAVPVKVGYAEALSLGREDLVLHVISHMATHLCVGGFGIRQVVDLAMLIKKENAQLNWEIFCSKVRNWKMEQFTVTIFDVVHQLFHIPIPEQISTLGVSDYKTTQQLIEDIMAAGVHGKRDQVRTLSYELANDLEEKKSGKQSHVLMNYMRFIFPSVKRISSKYSYVKKYSWLLPIGWIHHLWNGLFHSSYSKSNKLRLLVTSFMLSYRRNKLLKQLHL